MLLRENILDMNFPTDFIQLFLVRLTFASSLSSEELDKVCFILAGINEHDLLQAVDVAVEMVMNEDNGISVPNDTDENVSTKIVKLMQSYSGVVNKMVWRKE